MGHTSSPSIVGQFSISCQFRLVNALEVRILVNKETAVDFGDPEVFHGFQRFPLGDQKPLGTGIFIPFSTMTRAWLFKYAKRTKKTIAKVRIPNRARR